MRVVDVEPIAVAYPEPNDFNAERYLCLVKITADDGTVGWGEAITEFPEGTPAWGTTTSATSSTSERCATPSGRTRC